MEALIVSNALDTNGQNARYAKASEKWGTADGVLKALAIGQYDPASVIGRFAAAADKFGELKIRSVHRAEHIYQQMPSDIMWTRHNEPQIRELAESADIIHLNNSTVGMRRLKINRDHAFILHHHGSLFRANPAYLLAEARNIQAVQAVSTVDLMRVAPHLLYWAPTAYDIDWLQDFGKANRDDHGDVIRVMQAPTDGGLKTQTHYKSTAALVAAVEKVKAKGINAELVIVQDKPWIEAMTLKASADIYFDQVKLGYGCNAIEAWGMGIPVIAGADSWTLAKMREVYGTDTLPFYEATEDTITDAIVDLATSKAKRTAYAKKGMAHIRKFHDELPALTRLAELYGMAIRQEVDTDVEVDIPPATFRANVPQISVGTKRVTFVNGMAIVDNPHVATQLRRLAMRYPKYGIEETGVA